MSMPKRTPQTFTVNGSCFITFDQKTNRCSVIDLIPKEIKSKGNFD